MKDIWSNFIHICIPLVYTNWTQESVAGILEKLSKEIKLTTDYLYQIIFKPWRWWWHKFFYEDITGDQRKSIV